MRRAKAVIPAIANTDAGTAAPDVPVFGLSVLLLAAVPVVVADDEVVVSAEAVISAAEVVSASAESASVTYSLFSAFSSDAVSSEAGSVVSGSSSGFISKLYGEV